ncbi:MAG: phosphatidylserine/phosphatidylglycerophosphate/cardiolipin synthase family protein [Gammaproteobacteria bacterium]|nr:MAG: phosphatidylserine/phosphatidylglycerophosphate/cardiolipin synthase family protein [Gammaproteobacteria bacterium]
MVWAAADDGEALRVARIRWQRFPQARELVCSGALSQAALSNARPCIQAVGGGVKPFPVVHGNRVQWLEGEAYYEALLHALDNAVESVLFETYYCRDGQVFRKVMKALARAADRGVQVRVVLDSLGSAGVRAWATRYLTRPNAQIRFFNPPQLRPLHRNLRRDHRKLCVVDGRLVLTGGWGLADTWMPERRPRVGAGYWLDAGVKVEGPVIRQWSVMFAETWQHCGAPLDLVDPRPDAFEEGLPGRVACSRGRAGQELFRSLLARLKKAESRIWIVTPYFVTSKRLRRALKRAARRGVDVCVLVPGPYTDHPAVRLASWRHMRRLIQSGVRVYEYMPSFIHAKVVLVDDWVSVGSCNLDHWTQFLALEANQEVMDGAFADEVASRICQWLVNARRLNQDPLAHAPLSVRLLARFIGWCERVLYQFWLA